MMRDPWRRRDMTEDELLIAVLDALERYGWTLTHHRRSDRAVTMGMPGEPDIRGVFEGRPLWIECKSRSGRLSAEQAIWLSRLSAIPDAVVRVCRPDDLDPLLDELARSSGRLFADDRSRLAVELRAFQMVAV